MWQRIGTYRVHVSIVWTWMTIARFPVLCTCVPCRWRASLAPIRLKSDSVTTFLLMDNWVIWILKYSKIEPLFSLFFCLVLRRTDLETWIHSILNLNSILYRLAESDSLQPGEQHRWVYLDIQHAVRNWQIRQQPNYGLMLKLKKETSANAVMRFASSNHPLKHLHPKLIVCLTVPPW